MRFDGGGAPGWMRLLVLVLAGLVWPLCAGAADAGYLLDFGRARILTPGAVELSLAHLRMDEHIDLLDLREREVSASTAQTFSGLGDLRGARLLVNWGMLPATQLHGAYLWRDLDNGLLRMEIDSYELALRQQLRQEGPGRPALLLELGSRINRSGDQTIRSVADIDRFVKRINPSFSINATPTHLVISNGSTTAFFPTAEHPRLEVAVEDMLDLTPYLRGTCGWTLGAWEPALFLELGHSWIDSTIDSNLNAIVGTTFATVAADFPLGLDREESYAKAGFNLYGPGPWGSRGNLRYEYLRLERPTGLDAVDDNHILQADLLIPLTERWAANLGGTYYRRQLNGVVPFLYNRFTQSTFDHDYGTVHLGVVARF